jgi:hypothetical protein
MVEALLCAVTALLDETGVDPPQRELAEEVTQLLHLCRDDHASVRAEKASSTRKKSRLYRIRLAPEPRSSSPSCDSRQVWRSIASVCPCPGISDSTSRCLTFKRSCSRFHHLSNPHSAAIHMGAALLRPTVRPDDPEASQEFGQRSRRGSQGGGEAGRQEISENSLASPPPRLPVNFSSGISGPSSSGAVVWGHRGRRRAAPNSHSRR